MYKQGDAVVITLNSKRILVLGVLVVFSAASMYTYAAALFAFLAPSQELPLFTSVATLNANNAPVNAFSKGDLVRISVAVEHASTYYYSVAEYYYVSQYLEIEDVSEYFEFEEYYYYYYSYFESPTTYRVIVAVMDGNKMPVLIDSEEKTLAVGASQTATFDYTLPSKAATGTYTIRVMTWSDWLPDGRALAAEAGSASFTVS